MKYELFTTATVADLAALRSYVGKSLAVTVTSSSSSGLFYFDPSDTTSSDDGADTIVANNGKRWKRASIANFLQTGTGAVSRTFADKVADFVSVLDFIPVAEHAAIKAGTSTYDCYSDIMEAINSVTYIGTFIAPTFGSQSPGSWDYSPFNYRSGPSIYFPPGIYCVSDTVELKKRVTLWGDGSGQEYGDGAILKWTNVCTGIIVSYRGTLGATGADPGGTNISSGNGSVISGLALVGSRTGVLESKHAIIGRGRFLAERLYIEGFAGNAYHIAASVGGGTDPLNPEGNANNWQIWGGAVNDCNGYAISTYGGDVNAGLCFGLDIRGCGLGGVKESSFLGNTYVGLHCAGGAAARGYETTNANARNVFEGCYTEGGMLPDKILKPSHITGGIRGAGEDAASTGLTVGDQGFLSFDGTVTLPSFSFSANRDKGLYSLPNGVVAFSSGGANRGRWSNAFKASTSGSYFNTSNDAHEFVQSSSSLASSVDYLTSNAYTGLGKYVNCATASGTGFNLITAANAGGVCFNILGNGNAQNTNNSYGAISDAKLKTDVVDANEQSALDAVAAYRWVNYRLKADDSGKKLLGLIAQEALAVSPGVVYSTPDYEEIVTEVDGERHVERVPLGTETYGVNYSVVALQHNVAVQVLVRERDKYRRRFEQLEAQVAGLLSRLN